MIKLEAVSKAYAGVQVLDSISLDVPEASIFGIIGKSGAGKSTLLRIIGLLEKCDSGKLFFGDKRVDTLGEKELLLERRKMGMIFQNFNLFSSRNVAANISYPLEIAGFKRMEALKRVAELLNMVKISNKSRARLSALSGGQKQRVAIARALATDPKILFCDEATSALDPQTTREILALIKNLQERLQITVIIVTHQMEVVRSICSNVAVIDAGRIVETGTVDAVFSAPKSDAAKELLRG
ncbi:MAG: hypothetical protein Ta2A_21270 [Treponemataceae bacterium]|nr:MAG: hypothetical protein Ta2A_21270 [Treponemataceae bacterium]